MFKYILKYEDFLDNPQEETLRFNLTEGELRDLSRHDATFSPDILNKMRDDQDANAMYDTIRKLIAVSYGILSDDGKHFRKNEEITRDFLESAAYEAFIDKLVRTDDTKLIRDFIIGIFPAKFKAALTDTMNTTVANNR